MHTTRPPIQTALSCEFWPAESGRTRLVREARGPIHCVLHRGFVGRPDILLVAKDTAGLLEVDTCSLRIVARAGSNVLVSDPGPTKLLTARSDATAKQRMDVVVEEGARLIYAPHAVVPLAGSRASMETQLDVAQNCRLAYAGVLSPGRTVSGEIWDQTFLRQSARLAVMGEPIFHESLGLGASRPSDTRHLVSVLIYDPLAEQAVAAMREVAPEAAVVQVAEGLVCARAMVHQADEGYGIIRRLLNAWASDLPASTWGRIGYAA